MSGATLVHDYTFRFRRPVFGFTIGGAHVSRYGPSGWAGWRTVVFADGSSRSMTVSEVAATGDGWERAEAHVTRWES